MEKYKREVEQGNGERERVGGSQLKLCVEEQVSQ